VGFTKMSAKASVREKFSMEFVTGRADSEVKELKNLFNTVAALPDLELFDPDSVSAIASISASESTEVIEADEDLDPVSELRMLFGRVA